MKAVGFSGFSGAGKTTLIEQLIGRLKAKGLRVSVVKHAHHAFEIDYEGKDSWRHRKAGAFEVVVASDLRLAKIREHEAPGSPTVHQMLAELSECDWALVEGFKHADLPKIEVWRAATGHAPIYPDDRNVVAIATDKPNELPTTTSLPVFALDDVQALADFLVSDSSRYDYLSPFNDADA